MNPTPQDKDTTLDEILDDYVYRLKNIRTLHNAHFSKEIAKTELNKWRDKAVVEAKQGKLWYIVDDFGGNIKKGGFETAELALEFRQYYEQATKRTYAIEQRKPQLKETPNED